MGQKLKQFRSQFMDPSSFSSFPNLDEAMALLVNALKLEAITLLFNVFKATAAATRMLLN